MVPPEIIELFFALERFSPQDLRACTYVSQAFRVPAQRWIFHSITIYHRSQLRVAHSCAVEMYSCDHPAAYISRDRFLQLVEDSTSSNRLLGHVHELRLEDDSYSSQVEEWLDFQNAVPKNVWASLRVLHLDFYDRDVERFLRPLSTLVNSLRRLVVHKCQPSTELLETLPLFSEIKVLELRWLSYGSGDAHRVGQAWRRVRPLGFSQPIRLQVGESLREIVWQWLKSSGSLDIAAGEAGGHTVGKVPPIHAITLGPFNNLDWPGPASTGLENLSRTDPKIWNLIDSANAILYGFWSKYSSLQLAEC